MVSMPRGTRLEGKSTIITGAGSGLGEAAALRFGEEGAGVLCADIDLEAARATAAAIVADGGEAEAFEVDVADLDGTERMAAAAVDRWGTVDVLYANAGFTRPVDALECDVPTWDRLMDVNLKGAWLSARAVLPKMIEQQRGSIIFQASAAGLVGIRGSCPYAAAKAGVIGLCRQLAGDYGPDNVRVNAIAPGTIWTPLGERTYAERVRQGRYASVEEGKRQSSQVYPLRRLGELRELAALALFLASDESTWITGVTHPIDGGLSATRDLIPGTPPPQA